MEFTNYILRFILCSAVLWTTAVSPSFAKDSPASAESNKSDATVSLKSDSLLSYMDEENKEESENASAENTEDSSEPKNWISNLATAIAEKGEKVISSGDDEDTVQPRSNASVFDISGVMLRMNVSQVIDAMQKRGYAKTSESYEIPNFIRWRYEEACRLQGVIGYERILSCVVNMSQKNNYRYIEKLLFDNYRTQENMEIHFTSNFTGNKAYSIIYHSAAANIKGSGVKADYLRNIKVFDFWKKINQKYGIPDNKEQVIWGLGDNKPYLKAATGTLILHDPMLLELDYARMSREDRKFMNTAVYTF